MGAARHFRSCFDRRHWAGCLSALGPAPEPRSGLLEPRALGWSQPPVGADCAEPSRPHLRKPAADARLGGARGVADLAGFGFVIPAGDLAVFERNEVVMADGHSAAGGGQRPPCGLSAAERLTVNPPVSLPHLWIDTRKPLGLWSWLPARGPAEQGEGLHLPQAVFP